MILQIEKKKKCVFLVEEAKRLAVKIYTIYTLSRWVDVRLFDFLITFFNDLYFFL